MVSLAFPISPFLFTSTLKTTLLCLLSVLHYRRKNYMVEISLYFFLFSVFFFVQKCNHSAAHSRIYSYNEFDSPSLVYC
jgi:hypothetical protein